MLNLPSIPFYQNGYLLRLKHGLGSTLSKTTVRATIGFATYLVRRRNHLKYRLWKTFRAFEDKHAEHPGMTEEEQQKVDQILALMADLVDKENWNRNTQQLKQTEKL